MLVQIQIIMTLSNNAKDELSIEAAEGRHILKVLEMRRE